MEPSQIYNQNHATRMSKNDVFGPYMETRLS